MTRQKASYEDDVFFNIRLKPDLHERLKAAATKQERTLAATVRIALREYVERAEASAEVAA